MAYWEDSSRINAGCPEQGVGSLHSPNDRQPICWPIHQRSAFLFAKHPLQLLLLLCLVDADWGNTASSNLLATLYLTNTAKHICFGLQL
jgi:hypothetical protein